MVTKRCQWGRCNSDSRYQHRDHMKGVFFLPFPKPHVNMRKCQEWIQRCGRPHHKLNVDKINRYKYVCSKHFIGGNGPTEQHPDPIQADPYEDTQKPRKKSKEREPILKKPEISRLLAAEALLSLQAS